MNRTSAPRDGRDTRWAEHRLTRRVELVDATLRAIRWHGSGVGMDEIAHEAGTSKTVLYRHFGDKGGLYLAVAESVDRLIVRHLRHALGDASTDDAAAAAPAHLATTALAQNPRSVIEAALDAYLALVEADPEVYRFVVAHPLLDRPVTNDPVSGLTTRIADDVTTLLTSALSATGRDTAGAAASAHGLVGMVRAAADHWISSPDPLPRIDLVHHLSLLIWGGLQATLDPSEAR